MAQVSSSPGNPDRNDARDPLVRVGGIRLLASPEWFFLAIAIPFGMALLILTPPIQSPDEDFHLLRAFQLSEGRVIAEKRGDETGGELPISLGQLIDRFAHLPFYEEQKTNVAEIREAFSIPLNASERQFMGFSTIALQPPLGHVPQAVGLLLGRQVTQSVLVGLYLGRFFNLLASVLIAFWAIRRTPVCKWGFVGLSLLPMALFLAASLSSDGLTNALTSLFLAEILRAAFGDSERLTTRDLSWLTVLGGVVGGLIKQAYFPLAICFLLIPIRKLGSAHRYGMALALVLGVTFLGTAAWGFVVKDIYSPARLTQGINVEEQMELIRSDPGSMVKTLGWTVFYQFRAKIKQLVGVLGWGDVPLPSAARNLDLICLAGLFLVDFTPRTALKKRQVLIALGTVSFISLLVLILLHLTWNPVSFPYVRFQGRYFIPVAPLLGILFSQLAGRVSPVVLRWLQRVRPLSVAGLPCVLLVAIWSLYQRYYVDSPDEMVKRHVRFAIERMEMGESLAEARAGLRESLQLISEHEHRLRRVSESEKQQVVCLLEARDAPDAIRRLTELGSSSRKGEALLSLMLGKIRAADGDYTAALACFEKANQLVPGNEMTAFTLWNMRDFSRKMQTIQQAVWQQAHPNSIELCSTAAGASPSVLPPLEFAVTTFGGALNDAPDMVWRCQTPSGETIRFDQPDSSNSDVRSTAFFACSTAPIPSYFTPTMDKPFPTVVGKRVFVFPPPLNAVLLNDDQVSWFYQRRLIDLADDEFKREMAYREERQLTFPLSALPD